MRCYINRSITDTMLSVYMQCTCMECLNDMSPQKLIFWAVVRLVINFRMLVHFFNIQILDWPMREQKYYSIAPRSHDNVGQDVTLLYSLVNLKLEMLRQWTSNPKSMVLYNSSSKSLALHYNLIITNFTANTCYWFTLTMKIKIVKSACC